jgi:general secretion pathway protein N
MTAKFSIAIPILVLCVYGAASTSASIISDDASDDRSDGFKPGYLAASSTAPEAVQVSAPQPAPAAAAVERTLSANPLWAMPLAQFPATRERPIFSPSRRPPPPAVSPVAIPKTIALPKPKEPERPPLTLVGTIAGDEEGFGIFVDQASNAIIRLKVGEEFQGWKLQSVQGRATAMEKDRQVITLVLPQPGQGHPSGEAPPLPATELPGTAKLRAPKRPNRAGR